LRGFFRRFYRPRGAFHCGAAAQGHRARSGRQAASQKSPAVHPA
jgi:hypothetical protein